MNTKQININFCISATGELKGHTVPWQSLDSQSSLRLAEAGTLPCNLGASPGRVSQSPAWPQCLAAPDSHAFSLGNNDVQSTLALFYERQSQSWHSSVPTMTALGGTRGNCVSPPGGGTRPGASIAQPHLLC